MKERNRKFVDSLEIVRDHKKIKNIRCAQGEHQDDEAKKKYDEGYVRAFGRAEGELGSTGHYVWDKKLKKLVKVSDEVPTNMKGLISL